MRKTVMIGAMKPMTVGHYQLITEAVADSRVPDGEVPASETYVLISVQDRIKKGELPVSGEAALTAMRDVYLKNTDFMKFNQEKLVNLIFCYSKRFAEKSPERIEEIRSIINDIEDVLAANGITNVKTSVEESQSGPPSYLVDLANRNTSDTFVLYTGQDDVKKYQPLIEYAPNLELAGFERFAGGVSGTEARSLIQKSREDYEDDEAADQAEERFRQSLPQGVDSEEVRKHYREKAGLDPIFEQVKKILSEDSGDLVVGTEKYGAYLDEIIGSLMGIKGSLGSRKKAGKYFRKEADRIQSAISSLRYLKRKSDRQLLSQSNVLSEAYRLRADISIDRSENFGATAVREYLQNFNKKEK